MFPFSRRRRPFHLGNYPLERLARCPRVDECGLPALAAPDSHSVLGAAARKYLDVYAGLRHQPPFAERAPVPDDLARRAVDIKGSALFYDAAMVGICALEQALPGQGHAVVILVEQGRTPEPDNLAHAWYAGSEAILAQMRAAEIAVVVAGQIRTMGFEASAHWAGASEVDLLRLALRGGLLVRHGERCVSPYLGEAYALAAVSTGYEMAVDLPLDPACLKSAKGIAYALGAGGATSGLERRRRARRASHLSRYPMETVARVERPTTLILDDEVPRVPVRAGFFPRAAHGDLGDKAAREITRFAYKHPAAYTARELTRALVALQDGAPAAERAGGYEDGEANARALKSLGYALGADLCGICEIPTYAWYSHNGAGQVIEPYHRYALVMLIDQGFDTMEGASGDDWVSGAQSMRSYLRGGEIAGVMAEQLRALGFPARPQTNASSDVQHIPLILLAGLGELSRIGELVLNPFVGPRFKSVVLTTDMPLAIDQPIDFGLQHLCGVCRKCARECPCDAIPYGDKVMFNGYEIWKPDAERCARYRITNSRGAACGRCMKTCPLNKDIDLDAPWYLQAAKLVGVHGGPLKRVVNRYLERIDDWLGYGRRVAAKKWWLDLEIRDGITRAPAKGSNERELETDKQMDADKQKIAYYTADLNPPGDCRDPFPVDRKAALAAKAQLESVAAARLRIRS
jgi:reductive dehalogenase